MKIIKKGEKSDQKVLKKAYENKERQEGIQKKYITEKGVYKNSLNKTTKKAPKK